MNPIQATLYARVSSEQQNEAKTIDSQIADLQARIVGQGLALPSELEFVDNGYSGATLIRPALERLRDVAAAGGIDQLYVHCPDRLARNYAHQVLLLEEFMRAVLRRGPAFRKSDYQSGLSADLLETLAFRLIFLIRRGNRACPGKAGSIFTRLLLWSFLPVCIVLPHTL